MTGTAETNKGIVRIRSHHSVSETMDRLAAVLEEQGVAVFARIDFSGDAARAGLTMRSEQMLIFGNPKAGTPLLVAAPTAGLDLPIKALVWQDAEGKVWIAYNDPHYVVSRHDLAPVLADNLAVVVPLLQRAAREER